MLQRRELRERVSGELYPPDARRAGIPDGRGALHRPGDLHRLRRVHRRVPGRGDRPPDDQLTERDEPYLQINADYYKDHDVEGGLVPPRKSPQLPDKELHVAIIGAGPAAFYAAEELVRKQSIKVDMFDRLPTPYGLVRAGVAPDHAATKGVEKTFASVAAKKNFDYYLNVEVGKHISHDELVARYHAVIYAVGAATDKRLGIEGGEDLRNSVAATQFVAWYNGHPDFADLDVDLSSERAVVVGNGNVALDVARILVTDPDELAKTDIADHALAKLRESNIKEVVLLGRRGVAQAAYTNSEFLALGDVEGGSTWSSIPRTSPSTRPPRRRWPTTRSTPPSQPRSGWPASSPNGRRRPATSASSSAS